MRDQFKGFKRETVLGEGGEEEAPIEETVEPAIPIGKNYQIIGTLKWEFHKPTEDIHKIIQTNDEDFEKNILQCGFVIFDTSRNMETIPEAKRVLQSTLNNFPYMIK